MKDLLEIIAVAILGFSLTYGFFYWAGNPNSAHNVAYRKFEQSCKDKGGTIAHVRTSALPNTTYSCVNKDYFIEVK